MTIKIRGVFHAVRVYYSTEARNQNVCPDFDENIVNEFGVSVETSLQKTIRETDKMSWEYRWTVVSAVPIARAAHSTR